MTAVKATITQFAVFPEGENPLFGNDITSVSLEDEGGGYFLILKQLHSNGEDRIRIDLSELEMIIKTAKHLWGDKLESDND